MKRRRVALLACAVAAISVVGATAALAGDNDAGFKTSQAAMLSCPSCGSDVVPIITVGETMPGGYRFESIPDGVSLQARGNGRVDLFVNHETSTVAFPYTAAAPTATNSQNDFLNSQVSLLALNQHSKGVLSGRYAIDSSENYQRFCSNYLATAREGFDRDIFFTNEEGQDWVYRSGTAWDKPIAAGTPGAEQIGVVVANDPKTGKHKTIYGMGRHNHENDVAIPGFDDLVVLSGDDTFFTTPVTTTAAPQSLTYDTRAWSQVYSYIAPDTDAIWADQGDLWAFVSDSPSYKDYYDFAPGDTTEVSGEFVKVPKLIATGKKADGTELRSTDFQGMLPPPQGSGIPDGPQWVLDQWGNAANNEYGKNVFRFVRIEDIAYDKRPGKSNIVYLADSGRAQTGAPGAGKSTNGRIWKLVFSNKTQAKLSILIDGDTIPAGELDGNHRRTGAHCNPPTRQPRDDGEQPDGPRGSQHGEHVPGGLERSTGDERASLAIQLRQRNEVGRRNRRPVGRFNSGKPQPEQARQHRLVGVEWHRRRVVDLGTGLVPPRYPGAHALDRRRSWAGRRRSRRPGLDVQTRGWSAPRDQDPGRVARARRSRMRASLRRRPRRLRLQRRCGVETR